MQVTQQKPSVQFDNIIILFCQKISFYGIIKCDPSVENFRKKRGDTPMSSEQVTPYLYGVGVKGGIKVCLTCGIILTCRSLVDSHNKEPVMQTFDKWCCMDQLFNKQSSCWWFEVAWCSCEAIVMVSTNQECCASSRVSVGCNYLSLPFILAYSTTLKLSKHFVWSTTLFLLHKLNETSTAFNVRDIHPYCHPECTRGERDYLLGGGNWSIDVSEHAIMGHDISIKGHFSNISIL